jgi:hypothetical protein
VSYATREEFFAAVRRAQAGDKLALAEVRRYANDPGRRARAVAAALPTKAKHPQLKRKRATTKRAPRLETPPKGPINRAAVLQAIEILGLKYPVRIRWASDECMEKPKPGYRKTGEHVFTTEREHVIKLRPGRSAEATSKTLLHELGHGLQVELAGSASHQPERIGIRFTVKGKAYTFDLDPEDALELAATIADYYGVHARYMDAKDLDVAAPAHEPRRGVLDPVSYRLWSLLEAGYAAEVAEQLARNPEIDLHQAEQLAKDAGPELAAQILA